MNDKILVLDNWETPASSYREERIGDFYLVKHTYNIGRYRYYDMDGYACFDVTVPLTLMLIKEKDKEWMADSPPDYRAMQIYAERASGNVLTSGLGLGLVAHELCKNSKVESVTVVEREPSVIALISKYLPKKVKVVSEDFWTFIVNDNSHWDTIILDIWSFSGTGKHYELYVNEVCPAYDYLTHKYSGVQLNIHAFAGMPTSSQLLEAAKHGKIDEVLWGLNENTVDSL